MRRTIIVPTEDGRDCYLEFERRREGYWSIDISNELMLQAPQGVVAALSMALLEMRAELKTATFTQRYAGGENLGR